MAAWNPFRVGISVVLMDTGAQPAEAFMKELILKNQIRFEWHGFWYRSLEDQKKVCKKFDVDNEWLFENNLHYLIEGKYELEREKQELVQQLEKVETQLQWHLNRSVSEQGNVADLFLHEDKSPSNQQERSSILKVFSSLCGQSQQNESMEKTSAKNMLRRWLDDLYCKENDGQKEYLGSIQILTRIRRLVQLSIVNNEGTTEENVKAHLGIKQMLGALSTRCGSIFQKFSVYVILDALIEVGITPNEDNINTAEKLILAIIEHENGVLGCIYDSLQPEGEREMMSGMELLSESPIFFLMRGLFFAEITEDVLQDVQYDRVALKLPFEDVKELLQFFSDMTDKQRTTFKRSECMAVFCGCDASDVSELRMEGIQQVQSSLSHFVMVFCQRKSKAEADLWTKEMNAILSVLHAAGYYFSEQTEMFRKTICEYDNEVCAYCDAIQGEDLEASDPVGLTNCVVEKWFIRLLEILTKQKKAVDIESEDFELRCLEFGRRLRLLQNSNMDLCTAIMHEGNFPRLDPIVRLCLIILCMGEISVGKCGHAEFWDEMLFCWYKSCPLCSQKLQDVFCVFASLSSEDKPFWLSVIQNVVRVLTESYRIPEICSNHREAFLNQIFRPAEEKIGEEEKVDDEVNTLLTWFKWGNEEGANLHERWETLKKIVRSETRGFKEFLKSSHVPLSHKELMEPWFLTKNRDDCEFINYRDHHRVLCVLICGVLRCAHATKEHYDDVVDSLIDSSSSTCFEKLKSLLKDFGHGKYRIYWYLSSDLRSENLTLFYYYANNSVKDMKPVDNKEVQRVVEEVLSEENVDSIECPKFGDDSASKFVQNLTMVDLKDYNLEEGIRNYLNIERAYMLRYSAAMSQSLSGCCKFADSLIVAVISIIKTFVLIKCMSKDQDGNLKDVAADYLKQSQLSLRLHFTFGRDNDAVQEVKFASVYGTGWKGHSTSLLYEAGKETLYHINAGLPFAHEKKLRDQKKEMGSVVFFKCQSNRGNLSELYELVVTRETNESTCNEQATKLMALVEGEWAGYEPYPTINAYQKIGNCGFINVVKAEELKFFLLCVGKESVKESVKDRAQQLVKNLSNTRRITAHNHFFSECANEKNAYVASRILFAQKKSQENSVMRKNHTKYSDTGRNLSSEELWKAFERARAKLRPEQSLLDHDSM